MAGLGLSDVWATAVPHHHIPREQKGHHSPQAKQPQRQVAGLHTCMTQSKNSQKLQTTNVIRIIKACVNCSNKAQLGRWMSVEKAHNSAVYCNYRQYWDHTCPLLNRSDMCSNKDVWLSSHCRLNENEDETQNVISMESYIEVLS